MNGLSNILDDFSKKDEMRTPNAYLGEDEINISKISSLLSDVDSSHQSQTLASSRISISPADQCQNSINNRRNAAKQI